MKKSNLVALLILLLHGCTIPSAAPTSTATRTPLPPTATYTPTAIPPTPTATPISALDDKGPWLVHYQQSELDAPNYKTVLTNLDGSGYYQLDLPGLDEKLEISPAGSPNGPHAALRITNPRLDPDEQVLDTSIWILTLPDGTIIRKIPLVGEPARTWLKENPPEDAQGLTSTVLEAPFQWSPDGRYLAFSGALDGESTDLYIYDIVADHITQLTDGSKQAVIHSWSPDSKWIIHEAVLFYNAPSRVVYATWAASIEGEVNRLGYGPFNQHPIIGWPSEETLLTYTERSQSSSKELRTVTLTNGKTEFISNFSFYEAAYAPNSATILLNLQPVDFASADSLPGIYLLDPMTEELENFIPGKFSGLTWLTKLKYFTAVENEEKMILFDHQGELKCSIEYLAGDRIGYSPNQHWIAISGEQRSSIYNTRCETVLEINREGEILWLPDSSGFYFYASDEIAEKAIFQFLIKNNWEAELINPNPPFESFNQVIYP